MTTTDERLRALREALIQANGAWLTGRTQQIISDALDADDVIVRAGVPYTDPSEGDAVEVRLRMTVRKGHQGAYGDETDLNSDDFATLCAEGRVRLVKAAAPTFEPGRIYRDDDGDLWFRTADDIQPWVFLARDGHVMRSTTSEPVNPVLCEPAPIVTVTP